MTRLKIYFAIAFLSGCLFGLCMNEYLDSIYLNSGENLNITHRSPE